MLKDERVEIRGIRPDDRERLRAFFDGLDSESLYLRFHGGGRISDTVLDLLTDVDDPLRVQLVAVLRATGQVIGEAGFAGDPNRPGLPPSLGIAVDPGWRRAGLGSRLLGELTSRARARNVTTLSAAVLAHNEAMVAWLDRLGYRDGESEDGVLEYTIEVGVPRSPRWWILHPGLTLLTLTVACVSCAAIGLSLVDAPFVAAGILLAATTHEAAHSAMHRRLGVPTPPPHLPFVCGWRPRNGRARREEDQFDLIVEARIAHAGPLASMLTAYFLLGTHVLGVGRPSLVAAGAGFAFTAISLLPLPLFDGERITAISPLGWLLAPVLLFLAVKGTSTGLRDAGGMIACVLIVVGARRMWGRRRARVPVRLQVAVLASYALMAYGCALGIPPLSALGG